MKTNKQAIRQPLPSTKWQEIHDRMLFQLDTQSKTKTINALAYIWNISRSSNWPIENRLEEEEIEWLVCLDWKLCECFSCAGEDSNDDETGYIAALTHHGAYALVTFAELPRTIPGVQASLSYLSDTDGSARTLEPLSNTRFHVDSHSIEIGPCRYWFEMSSGFLIQFVSPFFSNWNLIV